MSEVNQHGVKRYIPEEVAKVVRQNSGFGCVICGKLFYHYHHIDPEFKDVERQHEADKICLLCPDHHAEAGDKRLLTTQRVWDAYRNPMALQTGFAKRNDFARLERPCKVRFGGVTFQDCNTMLMVNNREILGLEEESGRLLLNAVFFNAQGLDILEIKRNEWISRTTAWDIRQEANTLMIRNSAEQVELKVEILSPNEIRFSQLDMNIPPFVRIKSRGNGRLDFIYPSGKGIDNLAATLNPGGYIEITAEGKTVFRGGGVFQKKTAFRSRPKTSTKPKPKPKKPKGK